MTALHALFICIAGALSAMVAVFYKFYNPPEHEPITPNLSPMLIEPSQSSQAAPSEPVVFPDARVQPPVVPTDHVQACALAQQAFEGWYLPGSVHNGIKYPEGSASYAHNNPGNIRDMSGGEIHYITYAAGLAALEQYIRNVATGKHKAYPLGGATTIMQYTHIYTGDPEPSPTNYAHAIATAVGLSTTARMDALLS